MNTTKHVANDFKEKVSEAVRLHEEGVNQYRVFTPFTFDDGDSFPIVLQKNENGWVLSDEKMQNSCKNREYSIYSTVFA